MHRERDKKNLLPEETTSTKRNLLLVGGCTDTPVDLVVEGNVDVKSPCLGNGQTVLMRTPTHTEFVECWNETMIRNDLVLKPRRNYFVLQLHSSRNLLHTASVTHPVLTLHIVVYPLIFNKSLEVDDLKGLPPDLVDDPLFRKDLVTTSLMGQTSVYMGKGTVLGKRDTTFRHCHT